MSIKISGTDLVGVKLISPPTVYEDYRGCYLETYNERVYHEAGIDQSFIQDDISVSHKNVLRGIHGDSQTWKLISCLYGSFYLIIVNNDISSKEYRKWIAFNLSATNRVQILIPPKFGNGHLVTSETAIFHYKQTTEYDRAGQFTILWNDPIYNFFWPSQNPILSKRDAGYL
jgi:dTDP-4-dehydrorhamnose 3,5-epimerase